MGGDLRRDTMAQYRYSVTCRECGKITADTTDDGLFDKATAHRRAGHHEGARGGGHECDVEIEEETKEYRCPVCQTKCIGELLPELTEDEKEALGERIEDAIENEVKNTLTQREREVNK